MINRLFLYSLIRLLSLVLFLSTGISQDAALSSPKPRNWTNTQGKTIEGTLLAVEGEKVRLLVNGEEFVFPLAGLSVADNTFVKKWQAQFSVVLPGRVTILHSEGSFEIVGRNGEVIERFSGEPSISEVGVSGSGKKNVLPNQRKQISGGQSILTKTGASVDLYSPAGAVIQVQAETELHFPEQNDQIPTSSLELLKGRLFLNIDSKQLQSERKEFRLKTPTAILAVKGTKFFAEVKPGVTISGVYEGKVAGIIAGGQTEDIAPGWVGRFFKDNTETGKMSQEEREDRKIFDVISLRKSSLAERAWDWNTFDWEVHTLLKKDGPTGKQEVSNSNIRRGRNKAGNLAVQFRPVAKSYKYGEFRIDSVVPEFGDGFLGAEFRIRVNRELPLIITTIGADQKELEKKKGRLLDDKGFDYLVQFHDLATIQEHKNRYWRNYELKEDEVRLQKGQWSTHFVPFSRNDYTKGYEVKSWFIFLCFGPEVVANREMIELEVAPPTLVFRDGEVTGR